MLPTADELRLPVIPPAPPAPDDSERLLEVGTTLYRTACMNILGVHANIRSTDHNLIYSTMDLLRAMDIKPAEWIRWQFMRYSYTELAKTVNRPPVRFVFSTKAIEEFKGGDLALPRLLLTEPSKRYLVKRSKGTVTQAELSELWKLNGSIQDRINIAVQRGIFVWASRFQE